MRATSAARRIGFAALALAAGLLTGCMTSPTNNQHLGYYYGSTSKPLTAGGFLDRPNAIVVVEAFDYSRKTWVTFATARSSSTPVYWDGRNWYYWQTQPTRFGARMWDGYWGESKARLRAVSAGTSLFTFDEWNWSPDATLGDVAEGVNGQEVTIWGWQFQTDP